MNAKWQAAATLATGIVVLACYGGQPGDQFKLKDFPPSPFDLKVPSRPWPEPDQVIESVDLDVKLQPVTTNQAEITLIEEVTVLRSKLLDLDQRYGLVLAKLEQIQKQEEIPSQVIIGWMYGDLYRLLDGAAQMYVMLTTPEQVNRLREELRGKTIELSRLQAPRH